jgi:hypothetical protein
VAECLLSKHEALNSNPNNAKRKKHPNSLAFMMREIEKHRSVLRRKI